MGEILTALYTFGSGLTFAGAVLLIGGLIFWFGFGNGKPPREMM